MNDVQTVSALDVMGVIMMSTLFSIGGGNGQIALIQDYWVGPGLLEPALFAWAYAIGNFVPGPKVSFVTGIGYYMAGIPGAIAALAGIVIPTSIGASLASHWYLKFQKVINHMTLSATFVIAGMMTTAAFGLARPMDIQWIEYAVVFAAALAFAWKGLDAMYIVGGSAGLGALIWVVQQAA